MTRVCLDTSAYSRFKCADPSAVPIIRSAAWVGVPTVVLGELEAGFALGRQRVRNHDELDRFLAHPVVHTVDVDRDVADVYAAILVGLRGKRTPIPTNDIWIAACAASAGATLLTADRHYGAIDRIGVVMLDA